MKWTNVSLIKKEIVSYDELGNPVGNDIITKRTKGILPNWSMNDIANLGREFTMQNSQILLKEDYTSLKEVVKIRINDNDYLVDSVSDLGHWRLLYIRGKP